MVEYLVAVVAAVVLAALLAGQFLFQGVAYGPRSRRALTLLALPAAAVSVGVAALPSPAAWVRGALGLAVGAFVYLGSATAAVFRWRNRKIAGLIGDAATLRHRIAERQREVDRIYWQGGRAAPAIRQMVVHSEPPLLTRGECASAIQRYLEQAGGEARALRAQLAAWQAEFGRCETLELRGRARILEAVALDAPDAAARLALHAKLAALTLIYRDRPAPDPAPLGPPGLQDARQELVRLQEELSRLLQQRGALLQRRLPLD